MTPCCPYGNRVHKGNNCFLQYDHRMQICTLGCHDHGCKENLALGKVHEIMVNTTAVSRRAAITAAIDLTQQHDLHTRQHLVKWAEQYDEREMRPYPTDKPLVVVRANTGAGKTKALVKHLEALERQMGARVKGMQNFISGQGRARAGQSRPFAPQAESSPKISMGSSLSRGVAKI